VISLFYGTGFVVYMSFEVTYSSTKNVMASIMYIVIPQVLNPFIYFYSFRNREIKGALRHLIIGIPSFFSVVLGFELRVSHFLPRQVDNHLSHAPS
jgi:olfactory receptor